MEKSKLDPLPEKFDTLEEAAEFWESHDIADYWDQLEPVEVEIDLERRTYLATLEPGLARRVAAYAGTQGISADTLINLWLSEKLTAVQQAD